MQSCAYSIMRPHAEGVFKSDALSFSKHKLSKQNETSINLPAWVGVELARLGAGGDAHCGVLVRG